MANNNRIFECLPLYRAAISGDWEAAKRFFEENEIDLDVCITDELETCLHIAVGNNSSHRFVEELIERITQVGNRQMLRAPSRTEYTPLHYAASVGNTVAARLLVDKDPQLAQIVDHEGYTALKLAAWSGRKETLCYLLEVTKDVVEEDGTSPYRGGHGADLLTFVIEADFYDVALYIVNKYPDIVMEKNLEESQTGLQNLATQPNAFKSGSRLGFWQRIIYEWLPVNREKALQSYNILKPSQGITNQNLTKASYGFNVSLWSILQHLVPQIKQLRDSKVKHIQGEELVKQMCVIVISNANHKIVLDALGPALLPTIRHGIYELMEQCLHHYPALAWYNAGGNLFLAAISERQEKVYNLLYQFSGYKEFAADYRYRGENTLHIAGKLAPPQRLNTVTGAALQMQRELQWFKEVENLMRPQHKRDLDDEHNTPRMVFTREQKELHKEARQWMRDTSSSASVVAALIVTMAFAAIFTVPGGSNGNGKPLFLDEGVFILFAISDAVALFSSSTTVLIFLSILNSRFAEEDFLYALPKRLTLGLISLFISLSATMVAFGATLSLVLRDSIHWIAAPVILLASIPMTLFLLLQYPLLVELVRSTYGKGIFYK